MYLLFDGSASGKPKTYKADLSDTFNWPRLVHLSWIILDKELKPIKDYNFVAKPKGFELTEELLSRTSLEKEKFSSHGSPLEDILTLFKKNVEEAKHVFAHNLKFNESVVGAEYIRNDQRNPLAYVDKYCLMMESTYFCKIPNKRGGYKWPSLQELHTLIFKQQYSPINNARADVIAASRCFIALMKARQLDDIFMDE